MSLTVSKMRGIIIYYKFSIIGSYIYEENQAFKKS